jgi:hypothetical protein
LTIDATGGMKMEPETLEYLVRRWAEDTRHHHSMATESRSGWKQKDRRQEKKCRVLVESVVDDSTLAYLLGARVKSPRLVHILTKKQA